MLNHTVDIKTVQERGMKRIFIKYIVISMIVMLLMSCGPLNIPYVPQSESSYRLTARWTSTVEYDTIKPQEKNKKRSTMKEVLKGNFDSIVVKVKDHRKIITRNNEINEELRKMGEVEYNPQNPIPELITIKPYKSKSAMTMQDWEDMINYYKSLENVKSVSPNYKGNAFLTPNDPFYEKQWNMTQLGMEEVWDISEGSKDVIVAVIDSGFDYTLSDAPINRLQGRDIADNDDDVKPMTDNQNMDSNHGTHVAGTIAEATNNNNAAVGMAPNVTILPIKIFSDSNNYYEMDKSIQAIQYAIDNNANVINMSFGISDNVIGSGGFSMYQDICTEAFNKGIVLIGAAGNSADEGDVEVACPGSCDHVMAVGASDYDRKRAYYSQYGEGNGTTNFGLDIMAPGGDVRYDFNNDGIPNGISQQTVKKDDGVYTEIIEHMEGTSMACPHVSGLVGLMLSVSPKLTPTKIFDIIQETADKDMEDYNKAEYGHGFINPLKAVKMARDSADGNDETEYDTNDAVDGEIYTVGEDDLWEIEVNKGNIKLTIEFHTESDFGICLYDSNGQEVESSENRKSKRKSISFLATEVGTYKIKVTRFE